MSDEAPATKRCPWCGSEVDESDDCPQPPDYCSHEARQPKGRIILCDVDNVLSDDSWRVRFISWHKPDPHERFHGYHSAALLDSAYNLHLLARDDARVFLLTSMPEHYAYIREAWLRQYGVRYERVLYRSRNDHRSSVEVKRSMLNQLRDEGVPLRETIAAYDDRQGIVQMYIEEGLPGIHIQINDQEHLYHGHD